MVHAIADKDEVAALTTIGILRISRTKQLHAAGRAHLPPRLIHHTGHSPLMRFARTVHVEEFYPRPFDRRESTSGDFSECPDVEVVFAFAVEIEWREFAGRRAVVESARTIAVGRRARCVKQR